MKKIACLVILSLLACSRDAIVKPPPDANRRWVNVSFDTMWTVGGFAGDSTLGYPSRLTSVGDLIIVSDPGKHQVTALRVSDGSVAWTNGAEDGHSFRRVLLVWPQPGRRSVVVDEDSQVLTILDSLGRTVTDMNLMKDRFINAGCALRGRGSLVTSIDDLGPLYVLSDDAKTATLVPMTVLGAKGHDPLILQSILEGNRDFTTCIVATTFGGGLALWNGSSFTAETPYREYQPFLVPATRQQTRATDSGEVKESFPVLPSRAVISMHDVATVPGRVRVLFGGRTANRGRIIDDYDDRTLEYLGSALLPSRASEFATPSPDVVVVLTKQRGFPMIVALRQRAVAP